MFTRDETMMLIAACGVCEDMLQEEHSTSGDADSQKNKVLYQGLQEKLRALSDADGLSYATFAQGMKKAMQ